MVDLSNPYFECVCSCFCRVSRLISDWYRPLASMARDSASAEVKLPKLKSAKSVPALPIPLNGLSSTSSGPKTSTVAPGSAASWRVVPRAEHAAGSTTDRDLRSLQSELESRTEQLIELQADWLRSASGRGPHWEVAERDFDVASPPAEHGSPSARPLISSASSFDQPRQSIVSTRSESRSSTVSHLSPRQLHPAGPLGAVAALSLASSGLPVNSAAATLAALDGLGTNAFLSFLLLLSMFRLMPSRVSLSLLSLSFCISLSLVFVFPR